MSSLTFRERAFLGLNMASAPETLPEGWLTEATNALVVGSVNGAGGYVQTRPGKRAQLSARVDGGFTSATTLVDNAGVTWLVAAVGSTPGRIVRWKPGMNTVIDVTPLGTVNAARVQFAVLGEYLFVADGGPLKRVKNDWSFETGFNPSGGTTTGLVKPTYTPSAQLTSSTLAAFTIALTDAGARKDGVDLTGYVGPNGAALRRGHWDDVEEPGNPDWVPSGSIEFIHLDTGNQPQHYIRMDDPSGSFVSKTIRWVSKTNTNALGSMTRRPIHFAFSADYDAEFENDSVRVTITLYSDVAGTEENVLAEQEQTFRAPSGAASADVLTRLRGVFSFVGIVDDAQIASFKVRVEPGLQNKSGANGPYITGVEVQPFQDGGLFLTYAPEGVGVCAQYQYGEKTTAFLGGQHISLDMGGGKDWSKYQNIAIAYGISTPLGAPMRARLAFRSAPNGAFSYSELLDVATVGGKTYLVTDLSTMDASALQSVRYVDLVIESDLALASPNNGQVLFTLGTVTLAGNLTVSGATYEYRFTEEDAPSTLHSQAGSISASVQPTAIQAQADISLSGGVPANPGKKIVAWRRGGIFSDGLFRRLATFSAGAGSSDDAGWRWTAPIGPACGVLRDNVPDSKLLLAETLLDHESVPDNVTAIAAWNDRLALATTGSATSAAGLYVSQLQNGAATGMYYNGLQVPNLPDSATVATEGFYAPLTSVDAAGQVVRMVPFLGRLVLLFPTTRLVLTATDASDFRLDNWNADAGKGAVATNAVAVVGGRVLFLAPDGLRAFDLYDDSSSSRGGDSVLTEAIRPALSSSRFDFAEAALASGSYAKSAVWTHAGRLFLAVPTAASNDEIDVVYVLDDSTSAWARWNIGSVRAGVEIGGELFVLDAAGQIARIGNAFGDTSALGGAVSPVPLSVTTRGLSVGAGQVSVFALRFVAENTGAVDTATMLHVIPETEEANVTFPYALAPGQTRARLRVPGAAVTSRYVRVRFIANTAESPVRLRELVVDATALPLTR